MGNSVIDGGEDTGDPYYLCAYGTQQGFICIFFFGAETGREEITHHTVYAYKQTSTIHPIDKKFLPGVCLPVVELSTVPTSAGVALTAEETTKVDEAAALGVPIVLKMTLSGFTISGVLTYLSTGFFAGNLMVGSYQLEKTDSGWVITDITE